MDWSLAYTLRPLSRTQGPLSIGRFVTCVFMRGQRVTFFLSMPKIRSRGKSNPGFRGAT